MHTRGPGAYAVEPVVMRQASQTHSDWGPPMHDPRVERAFGTSVYQKVLAAVEAEYAERAARREPTPVIYQASKWCGRDGCRPATPCASCQGHRTVVRDSGAGEAPVQTSRPFPGQGQQGMAEPAPVLWGDLPERDTGGPDFMTARQQQAPQRHPGEGGQIVKGL